MDADVMKLNVLNQLISLKKLQRYHFKEGEIDPELVDVAIRNNYIVPNYSGKSKRTERIFSIAMSDKKLKEEYQRLLGRHVL
jgi:hypothetical protein